MSNLSSVFNSLRWARHQAPNPAPRPPVELGEASTEVVELLGRMELLIAGDRPRVTRLSSSTAASVYRVELAWGTVCVKRALGATGGPGDTSTAMARSAYETRWLRLAREVVPDSAPEIIAEHPGAGIFVMEWLEPGRYPSWAKLLEGDRIEPWVAAEIGHLLGRLHAASANSASVMQRFPSAASFEALCLEPRLRRGLAANPDCAEALRPLMARLRETRVALVHGSFVPENILVGPRGPVVVDADCATYGEPAFDFAATLAELLMWTLWRPQQRNAYRACFDAVARAYMPHVTWEMTSNAEARAALLVPALLLGTLDADAPAQRVVPAEDEARARKAARALILAPVERLDAVRDAWFEALAAAPAAA